MTNAYMSQKDLRKSATQCEVILDQHWQRIQIDYNAECCRVTTPDAYIKAECFSPKGNSKFRVRIEIESVADDEVSRPQQKINSVWNENGVFQYDENCAPCQSNVHHDRHFYTTLSNDRKAKLDYASCDHIWTTTTDGKTICQVCANIKLTRRVNAQETHK